MSAELEGWIYGQNRGIDPKGDLFFFFFFFSFSCRSHMHLKLRADAVLPVKECVKS